MMQPHTLLLYATFLLEITGMTSAQVHLVEDDVTLTCYSDSTSNTLLYSWTDEANGIRFISAGKDGEAEKSTNEKYENFEVSSAGFPGSTPMIIKGVQLEDELGPYRCTPALGSTGDQLFDIQLEVPGNVNIFDDSGILTSLMVDEGSVYNLTCTATGAKSPNNLELTWTPGDGAGLTAKTTYGNYSLVNYTRHIAYTASRRDSSLSCNLTGYENDVDDELVSAVVDLTVRYVPECYVTVNSTDDDDCREIELGCTCDAVPDDYSCSFFNGTEWLGVDDASGCSLDTTVSSFNTITNYSCKGTNDVGSGAGSEPMSYECYSDCPCKNGKCRKLDGDGYGCDCYGCYQGDICNLSPCDLSDIKEEKLELDIDESSACDALLFSHGTNFGFSCPSGIEMVDRNSSGTCKDGNWEYESDIACKIASWFIGTIAGILVISVIAVIVLLLCWKKKKNKERSDGEDGKNNSAFTGDGGAGADDKPDSDEIDTGKRAVDPAATPIPLYAEPDKTKNGTKKEMDKPAAAEAPIYAESTKRKKSQKSRENGTPDPHVPMENFSAYEGVEFKGKSQPGAKPKELQYAELEHKTIPAGSEIIQSPDEPTPYADIKGTMEDVI